MRFLYYRSPYLLNLCLGTEFTDQVTLASGLVIPKQSIGVASTSTGFDGGVHLSHRSPGIFADSG